MTNYTIRDATITDSPTITRMVRSESLDPNAIDWHYFKVLEVVEDGKPKIVSIGMVHPEGDIYEVDSVTTLPDYRGRGYADAVVHALLDSAPRPLYLLAETDLVAYYEKFGWRVMDEDAPATMRDQRDWVNDYFKGRVIYFVMGKDDQ